MSLNTALFARQEEGVKKRLLARVMVSRVILLPLAKYAVGHPAGFFGSE